jgi:hypothetical protein
MIRSILVIALLTGPLLAETPKITAKLEPHDLPGDLAAPVRESFDKQAVTAADTEGAICTFWLRKDIPLTAAKESPSYRSIKPGTLVGAIKLHRSWTDFRGQEPPAGVYTLRYVLQPESKDHEGTAPQRDFVILIPAAEDTKPELLPLKTIVQKSGKATGGTHPVVMLLFPHPKPAGEPVVLVKGKRIAIGVRVADELGFAFTLIGSSAD